MEGKARSQAGWVGRASLLLVLALVAAAAYAVQSRRSLAEYLVLRQLRAAGVADASLSDDDRKLLEESKDPSPQ